MTDLIRLDWSTWLPEPILLDGSTLAPVPIHLDWSARVPEPVHLDGSMGASAGSSGRVDLAARADTSG